MYRRNYEHEQNSERFQIVHVIQQIKVMIHEFGNKYLQRPSTAKVISIISQMIHDFGSSNMHNKH